MPFIKEPHAEPIPGYRLIGPLGRGGFGEVWKCEAPGGLFKAIKFVYGNTDGLQTGSARAAEELEAVQHIKAIRHPFLLSLDRVESVAGELIIIMELADENLHDVFKKHQQTGRAGIPRKELLGYLREAAEVLDLMNNEHHLQHLDIKPCNLFLVSKHIKVADFGLVSSLKAGSGDSSESQLGAITPIYAPPEVFHGQISRQCDQYSLAIVYQELLTGKLPYAGQNLRQLLLQHTASEPDLQPLPEEDRNIVGRALAKDPAHRFPSCSDFIEALAGGRRAVKIAEPEKTEPAPVSEPETISIKGQDTDSRPAGAAPPADLLPAYRFTECLGRSPLVDQWRVQAPDGRERLLKIVYGFVAGQRLHDALAYLRSVHHPGLAEFEVVARDPGRLALVMDPVKETMRDRFQDCQARKFPGIMRGELVDYVRAAAEALDYLYQQHSLHHLALSPRSLVLLADGRVQIADFGLAQLFWLPAGQTPAQRNVRYAAPELIDGHISRTCDQYSLAVIYHEMLTGKHPLPSSDEKPEARDENIDCPCLDSLPELDRQVIARALDPDPSKRWPSCTAMVAALENSLQEQGDTNGEEQDRFAALISESRSAPPPAGACGSQENLNEVIAQMIASVGGKAKSKEDAAETSPALSSSGDLLQLKFQTGLPLGSARIKLDAFCQQWYGQLVREDGHTCVFHVSLPSNFWRQWIGRQPGLEIQVKLARVHALSPTPIETTIEVRAFRCGKKRGSELLQEMGVSIVDSLRSHLLVGSNKRLQDRFLWPHAITVRPLYADGSQGEAISCTGKDISQTGMGFYLPEELETSEVLIQLPNTVRPPAISIPASLVRAKRTAEGWYEVGALFRIPALRKSLPELCLKES